MIHVHYGDENVTSYILLSNVAVRTMFYSVLSLHFFQWMQVSTKTLNSSFEFFSDDVAGALGLMLKRRTRASYDMSDLKCVGIHCSS